MVVADEVVDRIKFTGLSFIEFLEVRVFYSRMVLRDVMVY